MPIPQKHRVPCNNCDGTGWVYVPHKEIKHGQGGYAEMGTHVRCTKCKNGHDVKHSTNKT